MRSRIITGIIVLLCLFLTDCSLDNQDQKQSSQLELFERKPDHLLERTDLQEIVEIQKQRDTKKLKPYFTHKDQVLRARAAFAMASIQDSTVLNDLVYMLDDSDENVRLDAALAVRQNYGTVAPGILIEKYQLEENLDVKATLLTAIGYKGNIEDYDPLINADIPEQILKYQALSIIYYLEHNNICEQIAIDKMLSFIDSENEQCSEKAGYFFFRMKTKNLIDSALANLIRVKLEELDFDHPAAPYLLASIASNPKSEDVSTLLNWSRNGKSLRARSFAVDQMQTYLQYPEIRSELIALCQNPEFQIALAATKAFKSCKLFDSTNILAIKEAISQKQVEWQLVSYLLSGLWENSENLFVLDYIKSIPEDQELEFITALSEINNIEIESFEGRLTSIIHSDNKQVALATAEYLSLRLSFEKNTWIVDLLSSFLRESEHYRIKSDAILAMAHNMKNTFSESFRKNLFLNYIDIFEKNNDSQSLAICLLVLGDIQSEELRPIFVDYANNDNEVIRLAALGALDILDKNPDERIVVYRNEMLYSPILEMDWALLSKYGRFPRFIFHTKKGDIVIEGDTEQAPMAIQNLIEHINAGLMDSIYIYRVELNHVTQFGALGHSKFKVLDEITHLIKEEGSCGIGSFGKDTGSQHIAITHLMRPHNDGKYTTFGRVVEGHNIVKTAFKYDKIIKTEVIASQQ